MALERLAQAEAAWLSLSRGTREPGLDAELHRLVHTLKGDSRVVGYEQVHLLCQKLEDILSFAQARGYQVPDEVDLVADGPGIWLCVGGAARVSAEVRPAAGS